MIAPGAVSSSEKPMKPSATMRSGYTPVVSQGGRYRGVR